MIHSTLKLCVYTPLKEGDTESKRDFMMNMEALFSHAYLHREPSAPCQCITCSSEPSPGQQGVEGLGEVMALMGGAVAGDREDWRRRRRRSGGRGGTDGREVAGRMSSSAGGESVIAGVTCTCTVSAQQPTFGVVSSHRGHLLNMLMLMLVLNKIVGAKTGNKAQELNLHTYYNVYIDTYFFSYLYVHNSSMFIIYSFVVLIFSFCLFLSSSKLSNPLYVFTYLANKSNSGSGSKGTIHPNYKTHFLTYL